MLLDKELAKEINVLEGFHLSSENLERFEHEIFCSIMQSANNGKATRNMNLLLKVMNKYMPAKKEIAFFDYAREFVNSYNNGLIISEVAAKEFYRDLCGTVYGNANKNSCGVMNVFLIADHMNISVEKAKAFCDAMVRFGITEKQGGMYVV